MDQIESAWAEIEALRKERDELEIKLNIQRTATLDSNSFADGVERENNELRAELAKVKGKP